MRKLTDGFRVIGGGERWFAGANTDRGFSGSYGDIADEDSLEHLYVIKGGPGTGKSTLMKEAAERAEKAGFQVVRYLCGSDPDSLDAAVIDGRIALADGTAPHPLDLRCPGVSSSLVDLTRFWDGGALERQSGEIRRLAAGKREAYREAYRYLAAAGRMAEELRALALDCFDREKAEGFCLRLAKRLRRERLTGSGSGRILRRYSHAVTMKGLWATDAVSAGAARRYAVEDAMETSFLFMSLLAEALTGSGADIACGLFPLGDAVAGIRAGSCSFRIGRAEEGEIPIRMTRFVRPESAERGRLRLTERLAGELIDAASGSLSRAAECHFALESIYGSAMDYDRMAEYRRETADRILERLTER